MSMAHRGSPGGAFSGGKDDESDGHDDGEVSTLPHIASPELLRSLADVKGQAQFLLYLADQIEESLEQLSTETDACQGTFLCKILSMYSSQLESKHAGLGDKIAETCQEIYVSVREFDAS